MLTDLLNDPGNHFDESIFGQFENRVVFSETHTLPPTRSRASSIVTLKPFLANIVAHRNPDMPAPTMQT